MPKFTPPILKKPLEPERTDLDLPELPMRRTAPLGGKMGEWIANGGRVDVPNPHGEGYPWYRVLWLTGVDYFSTLGYQPGIALLAAGALSPIATCFLIAVTLLGALPVYAQVAKRSFAGQGSIAMLENLLSGWSGKAFVLILLGFASTDFVITMTLSAADAAQHAIENPLFHPYLADARLSVTIGLLAVLAFVFLMGFSEAIGVAVFVTVPYLFLNFIVIARGFIEILQHPQLLQHWSLDLALHGDWTMLLIAAGLIFPKLALGMSGFETGVAVMPLVAGGDKRGGAVPHGRIAATRKLLASAAFIMSFFLLTSSLVTTMLIPPDAYAAGGPASGRALAYYAHLRLGEFFGTVYDLSTITILWFAGASAMAGMLNLIPRYLPRFGMAPRWVVYTRPLVLLLFIVDVVVTMAFNAGVEAQGAAYATGVLVLMLSAGVAVALALGHEARQNASTAEHHWKLRTMSFYFWIISIVFTYTLIDNVIERPDGVIIASIFISMIILFSALSRYLRATELRVERMSFVDEESKQLFQSIVGKKVHLVPLSSLSLGARERKRHELKKFYNVQGPIAFVHVSLLDNRSEFLAPLRLKVHRFNGDYLLEVFGATAIANSIAYLSEQLDPITLFLGLTRKNLMTQSIRYLLFGEGEVGLSVYTILIRYWDWTPEEDVRPLIFLMSE